MKDKKSIAIVVLAAITAGIGIFTIVNNQSKLAAYDNLEKKHGDVTDERKSLTQKLQTMTAARDALDVEARQTKSDLGVAEQNVQTLAQTQTDLQESIKANDLKFVDELGKKDAEIQSALGELEKKAEELVETEKVLLKIQADATTTAGELDKAQKALDTEKKAFADLKTETDNTIAESKKMIVNLESKYDGLNRQKGALEEQIKNLNTNIDEITNRLNDSEGDRVFLERELVRLQGEKTELVRKMNDINYISARYKAIKDDLNEAKRLDWMRRGVGIYAKRKTILERNAELRGQKPEVAVAASNPALRAQDKISVELTSDGTVKLNGKIIEPEPKPESSKEDEAPKTDAGVSNPVAPKKVSSQD